MRIRVDSEDPSEHWGVRDFDGLTILDLGAGDFGRVGLLAYASTPEWWLHACRAARVIAVDADIIDMLRFADERIFTIAELIDSPGRVDALVAAYQPDVLKVDIEGAECHVFASGVPTSPRLRCVLVEVHSDALDRECREVFSDWTLLEVRDLVHVEDYCRVVVFARGGV